MSVVKRYQCGVHGAVRGHNGRCVAFADYDADATALRAELAAMTAERDRWKETTRRAIEEGGALFAERDALRAEIKRYVRAVEVLFDDESGDLDHVKWYICEHVLAARAER